LIVWSGASFNWVGGWNVDTGGYLTPKWQAHSASVNCIKFLSTYTIVSGSSDKKLYVWDVSTATQTLKATFSGHSGNVNCCDKLLNGNVVSAGDDKAIYIWNPANGNSVTSKSSAHSTKILCLKVLYINRILFYKIIFFHILLKVLSNGNIATGAANGDTNIKIWSTSLGTQLMTLYGHSNDVLVIDQLSNGNIISGSADHSAIIWDSATGNQVNNMQPISSTAGVNCLKELPDGNIAFAGGTSQAIYTWKISGTGVQNLVATSTNIISSTPCQTMIIYNGSLLAVASSGTAEYLIDMTSSTNLHSVKSLNSGMSYVTCLDTQGKHVMSQIK
jgi:WD40 repeat protein